MTIKDLKKLLCIDENKKTLIKSIEYGEIKKYETYDDFKKDSKYDNCELDDDDYVFFLGINFYSIWIK